MSFTPRITVIYVLWLVIGEMRLQAICGILDHGHII
uniref:Uncharacterized protein n=1 Tax=Anguilla anguilla TaxID=7936 RepID=A0A0E9TDA9_ANGAN